jgi:XTP/dITP diphosphohydrolase
MMRVVVGTKNAHKIEELERILVPLVPGLQLIPAEGPSPEEDGETFGDNALIKARVAYAESGIASIADDSGLVVRALGGRPGIYSARYSGSGDDAQNTALVLSQMAAVDDRAAHFVCAAALVWEGGEVVLESLWEGTLAKEPAGAGGFGYDPIFIPHGHALTSAELSPNQKDALSHRGQAFRALAVHVAALR